MGTVCPTRLGAGICKVGRESNFSVFSLPHFGQGGMFWPKTNSSKIVVHFGQLNS
jgi:hypothetical protein